MVGMMSALITPVGVVEAMRRPSYRTSVLVMPILRRLNSCAALFCELLPGLAWGPIFPLNTGKACSPSNTVAGAVAVMSLVEMTVTGVGLSLPLGMTRE